MQDRGTPRLRVACPHGGDPWVLPQANGGPEGRLPPGQYDTGSGWPVLTAEVTPRVDTATWTITVDGLVERPTTWTWDELHALPPSTFTGDIHCVTTWSKLDRFSGVSVDTLLEAAGPARRGRVRDGALHTGYTTNLPLADVTGGKAWVVWSTTASRCLASTAAGAAARPAPLLLEVGEVGHPARADVRGPAGVLERNGYHDRGDPWREQRYQGD